MARGPAQDIFFDAVGAEMTVAGWPGKEQVRQPLSPEFGYDLDRRTEEFRPFYDFDISCRGFMSEALIRFPDSDSRKDTALNAVSPPESSYPQTQVGYRGLHRQARPTPEIRP